MSTVSINRHRRSRGRYARATHRIRNTFAGIGVTLAGLLVIGACTDDPAEDVTYVPCTYEDQELGPCFWDASDRGNQAGRDFVVTPDGSVLYDVPIEDVR